MQIKSPELWLIASAKHDQGPSLVAGTTLFFHYIRDPRPEAPRTHFSFLLEGTHITKGENSLAAVRIHYGCSFVSSFNQFLDALVFAQIGTRDAGGSVAPHGCFVPL